MLCDSDDELADRAECDVQCADIYIRADRAECDVQRADVYIWADRADCDLQRADVYGQTVLTLAYTVF